ncbi:MAG: 1,4-dihydroxy-2-naphthoate polyprenyltransferase [Actinomycetota bacterium]|nr:1,4-dihydroxy-2-naphthoate polyprenyltransferase [Actinomycetota bacterium]
MRGVPLWVEAARPKTLVAGAVPVLVGTAASERFSSWRFLGALAVAVSMQVGVNFANDYFDAVRGVDTPERLGPRRLTAAGVVTPEAMRTATIAAFGVGAAAGFAVAAVAGWELLVVGAVCILAALGYSGGPRPYGSAGLGEVFVFVFFGPVATVGSGYVQSEEVLTTAVWSSVPVGLLATAILVANNLRDIEGDRRAGKLTLAVKLGREGTQRLYRSLIGAPYLLVPVVSIAESSAGPLLALLSAPLAWPLLARVKGREPRVLVGLLVQTARLLGIFGILLAAGLWIGRWI